MKNPERLEDDRGFMGNDCNTNNLPDLPRNNNSTEEKEHSETHHLARRDAAAMVKMLNKLRSGLEPYQCIYESLKKLHGKPFEDAFRQELIDNR